MADKQRETTNVFNTETKERNPLVDKERFRGGDYLSVLGVGCLVSTDQIRQYIQEKVNIVVQNSDRKVPISVWVHAVPPGRREDILGQRTTIVPIILSMDGNAIKVRKETKESDIGRLVGENQSSRLEIRNDIFAMLNNYRFNEQDFKNLNSPATRREQGITQGGVKTFQKYSNYTAGKTQGGQPIVSILLDPSRIVRDMLIDTGSIKTPYRVNILSTQMTGKRSCNYTVFRYSKMNHGISASDVTEAIEKNISY